MTSIDQHVASYQAVHDDYDAFTNRIGDLIDDLLERAEIKIQSIEARTKSIESFAEKINRPTKSYSDPMNELPDLSGVRILVYYSDDVDTVGEILREEFEIVEEELAHLPNELDADRFGYLSAHYIVRLSGNRLALPEWEPFREFRAEVQIRTVLQHAWAAISRALQYKQVSDVPAELKRRLFRLAGLFELADEEFVKIRDLHQEIAEMSKIAITSGDTSIALGPTALDEFLANWSRKSEIIEAAESAGFNLLDGDAIGDEQDTSGRILQLAQKLGVQTVAELEELLDFDPKEYFERLIRTNRDDGFGGWGGEYPFFVELMLIRAKYPEIDVHLLESLGWGDSIASRVIGVSNTRK